ncbi:MAG: ABC-F family ATP-binding cassette domain-containing protein [Solirubrobacterales bacterium]|nr:ABC-F family ATP-binding cassette domain-containing protein [Solirubrobacterales bacterium]
MSATLLVAEKVSVRFADRTILDRASLVLGAGSRVGLIGPNGSGKTTLLSVLAGARRPDSGSVRAFGTVGLMSQIPQSDLSARELIRAATGVAAASERIDHWGARLQDGDLEAIGPHAEAVERWVALGGEDVSARISAAGSDLALSSRMLARPVTELSGGQLARVGLAAIAVCRYDVLLLDEPTNHLDADGLARLRRLLEDHHGAVLVASHNRALLSEFCSEIIALDPDGPEFEHHHGGYQSYVREREARSRRAEEEHAAAVAERRELLAAERQIRGRAARAVSKLGQPDNDKAAREYFKARADGMQNRARKLAKRRKQIQVPDRPRRERTLRLELTAEERKRWIVALEGARWAYADWELGPIDLALAAGERLLLRGPNGSGKSTLISTLAGRSKPASGTRRLAAGAVVAELGQMRRAVDAGVTLSASVQALTGLDEAGARGALAWFGLGAREAERSPLTLSGGERTRAELAVVAHMRASCLLLDEPTNHLDTDSLEVLESALADWPGALVVATHDPWLTERLAPDRVLVLK